MEANVIKRVQITVVTTRVQLQMDHASVQKDIMVNVVQTSASVMAAHVIS